MKSDVHMTEADPGEAPGLDIVRRQAIETGFTDAYDRDDFADLVAQPNEDLSSRITDKNYVVLVVKSDLTPFAYGILKTNSGEINGLYTAETYQREGHASKIVRAFEERLQPSDQDSLTVDAPINSVGFFEAMGFQTTGETVHETHGFVLRTMRKELS